MPILPKFQDDIDAIKEHGFAHRAFVSPEQKDAWKAGDRVLADKAVYYAQSANLIRKDYRGSAVGYMVWIGP